MWADERAIRQVILNLLSNEIKSTPQGGTIKIRIGWTASGGQYVAVRDSGSGIPEDELPIVMSSFAVARWRKKTPRKARTSVCRSEKASSNFMGGLSP